jgi:hypothetical protein
MNQRQIIEAMEGCRTSPDAGLPELADALNQDAVLHQRFERMRQWDEVVGDALHACPVPEGLCDRLLDALALNDAEPAADSFGIAARPLVPDEALVDRPPVSATGTRRRTWLRRSLWLAASLSGAALILVAVVLNRLGPQTPQLTAEFADEIIDWTQTVSRSGWKTDFVASELRSAPFAHGVQAAPRRWTCIETRYAAQTVVYDLTVRHNEPTYLFCFASGPSTLPGSPPSTPFSTTGGFSIGAWQHGGHVYVLAVRGGERRYRGLVQSPVILGSIQIRENSDRTTKLRILTNSATTCSANCATGRV